jgi:hypothetical protein
MSGMMDLSVSSLSAAELSVKPPQTGSKMRALTSFAGRREASAGRWERSAPRTARSATWKRGEMAGDTALLKSASDRDAEIWNRGCGEGVR